MIQWEHEVGELYELWRAATPVGSVLIHRYPCGKSGKSVFVVYGPDAFASMEPAHHLDLESAQEFVDSSLRILYANLSVFLSTPGPDDAKEGAGE